MVKKRAKDIKVIYNCYINLLDFFIIILDNNFA